MLSLYSDLHPHQIHQVSEFLIIKPMFVERIQKGNNLENIGVGFDPVVEVLDPSEDGRIVRIAPVEGKRSNGHLQPGHDQR